METDDEKEYQEYLERVKEYEKRVQEEEDWENFEDLNTGIKAIDRTYIFDRRVEALTDAFNKAIDYIEAHTDLTKDEIRNCVNENIWEIELKEGYSEDPNGIGYVDNVFNLLSVNINVLKEEPEYVEKFIRHEMTHMIGRAFIKQLFKHRPILVSGYSREDVFDFETENKNNESFNEAAVEMFVAQDEEYREEKVLDFTINTNQDLNGGLYCLNSNLIHQMLIARGIDEQDFFKGLYDYKTSKKMIGKFKKSTFKELSSNMDCIFEELNGYYDMEDEVYELQKENEEADVSQQEKQMDEHKQKLESVVSSSERMIIDKILLPRLRRLNSSERQAVLSEYDKFIISEREYFKEKTNYKAVVLTKKQEEPWLQHVDVEPLDVKTTARENGLKREKKDGGRE